MFGWAHKSQLEEREKPKAKDGQANDELVEESCWLMVGCSPGCICFNKIKYGVLQVIRIYQAKYS